MIWFAVCYVICLLLLNLVAFKLSVALNPKRWLWVAFVGLFVLIHVLPLLVSCKPKAKPAASGSVTIPTVDSARINLQNQADASRSAADSAAQSSKSTVTNYERDVKTYDSIRVNLP